MCAVLRRALTHSLTHSTLCTLPLHGSRARYRAGSQHACLTGGRGAQEWHMRRLAASIGGVGAVAVVYYYTHLEDVPLVKPPRRRFIMVSSAQEADIGRAVCIAEEVAYACACATNMSVRRATYVAVPPFRSTRAPSMSIGIAFYRVIIQYACRMPSSCYSSLTVRSYAYHSSFYSPLPRMFIQHRQSMHRH